MFRTVALLFTDKKGATAIEYGLIAALIAIGLFASLSTLGQSVNKPLNTATDTFKSQN